MKVDPVYPKMISEGWPGVPFDHVDAAISIAPNSIYFFLGNPYVRFNMLKKHANDGYPEQTSKLLAGLTLDRIDVEVYWCNTKVLFSRENQYIRYNIVTYQADPGYPRYIVYDYIEDWKFLD